MLSKILKMINRILDYLIKKEVVSRPEKDNMIEEFSLYNKVTLLEKNIDDSFCHPKVILEVNELLFRRYTAQEQLQILADYIAQIWVADSKAENDSAFMDIMKKIIDKRRFP
jgi:hypothetical protein